MKQRISRILAITLTVAVLLTIAALPASAAYSGVTGENIKFDQFLVVEANAKIPKMTFTYFINPGTAIAATADAPAIIAGVGNPIIGTAAFNSGETTHNSVQGEDEVILDTGEHYAKREVSVDFTSVQFEQPGIYRYVIQQNPNPEDNKGVSRDTQVVGGTPGTRYLDVYVTDVNGGLVVSEYVLHKTTSIETVAAEDQPVSDKSTGFVNEITSHELYFGKKVTGNQGSKEKYFRFTLTINNAQANTTYDVDLTRAEATPSTNDATFYETMSNPASLTTGAHGVVTSYFYLKDGQYITIKGLPDDYKYELSEDKEDYKSTETIDDTYKDDAVNTSGTHRDIYVGFTNDRGGVIPTGILLTIAPFAIGLLVFGAIVVYMLARKKREY